MSCPIRRAIAALSSSAIVAFAIHANAQQQLPCSRNEQPLPANYGGAQYAPPPCTPAYGTQPSYGAPPPSYAPPQQPPPPPAQRDSGIRPPPSYNPFAPRCNGCCPSCCTNSGCPTKK